MAVQLGVAHTPILPPSGESTPDPTHGRLRSAPKKGYISLRRAKQFAMIQPSTMNRIDVGLILKDHEPTDRLESAKGFNALFTHRVRIQTVTDIDDELCGWLRHAYQRAG
jgi:Domain of unknown function (DUF5655)